MTLGTAATVVLTLLLCSAFFSASEIAFLSIGRLRARQLADEDSAAGRSLNRLLSRPSRLLATLLVAITSLNYTAEAIATSAALDGGLGLWVPLLVVPVFVIIVAEVTPILYASQNSERVALIGARIIPTVRLVLYPAVALFTGMVNVLLRLFGLRPQTEFSVTEEEIKLAIEVAEEEGVIQEDEGELLTGVMEFHDKRVREVLVPRVDMVCVEQSAPLSEVLKRAVESHHSRIPVYAETTDRIVGVVYAKDLIPYLGTPEESTVTAADLARDAHFVPDTRRVNHLLQELQQVRRTLAIVYGEHGGIAGLVTVEDLLEEIVGEIVDEHDDEAAEHERVAEDIWVLDPRLTLRQVDRLTGVALLKQVPDTQHSLTAGLTEADTLRELLLTLHAVTTPKAGDRLRLRQVELVVEGVEGLRIDRVRLLTDLTEEVEGSSSVETERA